MWRLDGVSTVRREAHEVRRRRGRVLGGGAWLPPFREEGKTGQAKSPWRLWNKSLKLKYQRRIFSPDVLVSAEVMWVTRNEERWK